MKKGFRRAAIWFATLLFGVSIGIGMGLLMRPSNELGETATHDARRAHCLRATNRAKLAEVAVALKTARTGSTADRFLPHASGAATITIEKWGDDPQSGFDRTCQAFAIMTARQLAEPQPSPWGAKLLSHSLVGVIVGSILTLSSGRWSARRQRQEALMDALDAALRDYVISARDYINAWVQGNPGRPRWEEPETRRTALRSAVRRLRFSQQNEETVLGILNGTHEAVLADWPTDKSHRPASAAKRKDQIDRMEEAINGLNRTGSGLARTAIHAGGKG